MSSLLFLLPETAQAIKGDTFGLTPVYPDNQQGEEIGYFNLLMTPGQEQDIELEIKNSSNKDINVTVSCEQSATSDAGVITYNEDKKPDSSTKYPFKEIATLDKTELAIPASGSEKVKVHLKMPKDSYKGKIIGGITVAEKREATAEEKKQAVVNEFQYAIPIILYEDEEKIEPDLALTNVEPGLRNYRPYIETTLQNKAATNISTMQIDGKIIWRKSGETLISRKETTYKMAPNSSFNFGFDLQNSSVQAGDFIAEFTIVADGKTFNFKKEFTITKAQAEEINSENLYAKEEKVPWWLIVISVVVVVGAIALLYYVLKKKKNKQEAEKRMINQKKKVNKQRTRKQGDANKKEATKGRTKANNSSKKVNKKRVRK